MDLTSPTEPTPAAPPKPRKFFGPQLPPGILNMRELLAPRGWSELIGKNPMAPARKVEELHAHEWAVVQWLRKQLLRASNPFEASNVAVLLVGEGRNTRAVDHQLDHIGGGLVSCMDGLEIAHGEYAPAGMYDREPYSREWSIKANLLGNRCEDVSIDEIQVTAPDRGELGDFLDVYDHTKEGLPTLALAKAFMEAFPGHTFKVVGAWCAEVAEVSTVAEAEEFFAKHGELTDAQADVLDEMDGFDAECSELVLELVRRAGGRPVDALKGALRAAIAAAELGGVHRICREDLDALLRAHAAPVPESGVQS